MGDDRINQMPRSAGKLATIAGEELKIAHAIINEKIKEVTKDLAAFCCKNDLPDADIYVRIYANHSNNVMAGGHELRATAYEFTTQRSCDC